jgi:hypothetical protein
MERLTEERRKRTWRLFRIGWYVNVALVFLLLLTAFYLFDQAWGSAWGEDVLYIGAAVLSMVSAAVLLMGAGISRYQARLEGQHLEIKLAVQKVADQLSGLKAHIEREQLKAL